MGAGPESNASPEPPPSFAPEDRASITSDFLVGHTDLQPDFLEQKNLLTRGSVLLLFVPVCDRALDVCAGHVLDSRKSAAPPAAKLCSRWERNSMWERRASP